MRGHTQEGELHRHHAELGQAEFSLELIENVRVECNVHIVEMSVARGYREVVWPAVWPAAVVVAVMVATREAIPQTLVAVLADLACGALLYVAIFFLLALPRDEREWFTTALTEITGLRAPGLGLRTRKSEA